MSTDQQVEKFFDFSRTAELILIPSEVSEPDEADDEEKEKDGRGKSK